MKKIIVILAIMLSLVSVSFGSVYKDLVINDKAKNIMDSFRISSDFYKARSKHNNKYYDVYVLKNNTKSQRLANEIGDAWDDSFSSSQLDISYQGSSGGYKALANSENRYMNFIQVNSYKDGIRDWTKLSGVCISFVLALTDYERNEWKKRGDYLSPSSNLNPGTVIASKINDDSGHIAILVQITKNYIWLMDQNSFVKLDEYAAGNSRHERGVVTLHKIYFGDKSDSSNNLMNAYNYSAIKVR
jgi:hypothetical protein